MDEEILTDDGDTVLDVESLVEEAHEALNVIDHAHFEDWITVARALAAGRGLAMHMANTNQPAGSTYNRYFGDWLVATKLDERMDKGTRSRLFKVYDNLDEIRDWRETLPLNKQRTLNHPDSVLRAWNKLNKVSVESTKLTATEVIRELRTELANAKDEIERLKTCDGNSLDLDKDTVIDIATTILGSWEANAPGKLSKLVQLLTQGHDAPKGRVKGKKKASVAVLVEREGDAKLFP